MQVDTYFLFFFLEKAFSAACDSRLLNSLGGGPVVTASLPGNRVSGTTTSTTMEEGFADTCRGFIFFSLSFFNSDGVGISDRLGRRPHLHGKSAAFTRLAASCRACTHAGVCTAPNRNRCDLARGGNQSSFPRQQPLRLRSCSHSSVNHEPPATPAAKNDAAARGAGRFDYATGSHPLPQAERASCPRPGRCVVFCFEAPDRREPVKKKRVRSRLRAYHHAIPFRPPKLSAPCICSG